MRHRLTISAPIAALFLTTIAVALPACVTNVATGRRQLNLLSRQQEIALGEQTTPRVLEQYGGRVESDGVQEYVDHVGQKLVPFVEGPYLSLPWEFTLLDSEEINAFALPGGKVFITRGLASKFDDEAQLAGVLGHEIGHVTAEHADKRLSGQLALSGVALGVSVAVGDAESDWIRQGVPLLVGVGGQGFLLKFSRDEEHEADSLGLQYMTRAGYDPSAMVDVMEALSEASSGSAGARPPEFLSTHPHPESRIRELREMILADYDHAMDNPAFVRNEQRYQQRLLEPLAKMHASKDPPAKSE